MAHAFDTGQLLPQRTRIRRGVVRLLSGLTRANGGYLMSVIPWGGIVRVYTDVDGISTLVNAIGKAPAIAVSVGDRQGDPNTIGGFTSEDDLDVCVYMATDNLRNQLVWRQETDVAGLSNDQADPGLDVIMDHVKELLMGQRVDTGKDIKQLRCHREYELATTDTVSIWVQEYKIRAMVQISEARTVTQLLTSIGFRGATNPAEVHLPAPPIDPGTVDGIVTLT